MFARSKGVTLAGLAQIACRVVLGSEGHLAPISAEALRQVNQVAFEV